MESVIVFDEIGLAEISKDNPLKVLHFLLEPSALEIGFIGLSNWRLDLSKMNRVVFVSRPDPTQSDLKDFNKSKDGGIQQCSSKLIETFTRYRQT